MTPSPAPATSHAACGFPALHSVLHFATHALVHDESPLRSALLLGRSPAQGAPASIPHPDRDGSLTAAEIGDWKLDAELVTLSACRTGLGPWYRGEGYVGLTHAFLQAGARNVMVSLWKVDDEATSLLMQRFYVRYVRDGLSAPEALQDAQRWLREQTNHAGQRRYDHPFYWSAFVLFGADS